MFTTMLVQWIVQSTSHTPGAPAVPLMIDDLFICAMITHIDGPGGILGHSAAEFVRDNGLPAVGYIKFDAADVPSLINQHVFNKVILYEMGHVYGISAYSWRRQGLLSDNNNSCRYKAATAASKQWQLLTGCTNAIPVELNGGDGTACCHWDETCLQGELMSGYLSGGMQLSRMTVGTLQDLGYTVDYNGADDFGIDKVNPVCAAQCPGRRLNFEQGVQATTVNTTTQTTTFTARRRELTTARLGAIQQGQII